MRIKTLTKRGRSQRQFAAGKRERPSFCCLLPLSRIFSPLSFFFFSSFLFSISSTSVTLLPAFSTLFFLFLFSLPTALSSSYLSSPCRPERTLSKLARHRALLPTHFVALFYPFCDAVYVFTRYVRCVRVCARVCVCVYRTGRFRRKALSIPYVKAKAGN